jgi:hypothetical protein
MPEAWVKIGQELVIFHSDLSHCLDCVYDEEDGYGAYELACCCVHHEEYQGME